MTNPNNELLFVALGGSGEIGMNVNLYGCDGKWLMVDCGITFADPEYPGIDIAAARPPASSRTGSTTSSASSSPTGTRTISARCPISPPISACRSTPSPFTAGLIREKFDEEGITKQVKLRIVKEDQSFKLGPFGISYVPLAHSIPEGNAILIDTPYGKIFHTGDWKIDESPLHGSASTAAELTAVGDEGIFALVCDSTNVFNAEASAAARPTSARASTRSSPPPRAACSSPPSPPTPRGSRRWARSPRTPGASCASPGARSTASCASPRRRAI